MGTWRAPGEAWHTGTGATALVQWDFRTYATVSDRDPDFSSLLEEFLGLPLSDAQAATAFAIRWGVPGVCWSDEHRKGLHPRASSLLGIARPPQRRRIPPAPGPPADDRASGMAPLRWWREVARRLEAASRLNADLAAGDRGDDEDWDALWGVGGVGAHPVWQRRPKEELRWVLDELVRRWLADAHVHPGRRAEFRGGAFVTPIDPRGVDGALVQQLHEALERGDRPLTCSAPGCGRVFLSRTRRSRPGESRYCGRHDKAERLRLSQRARRESMTDEERATQRARDADRMRRGRAQSRKEGRKP